MRPGDQELVLGLDGGRVQGLLAPQPGSYATLLDVVVDARPLNLATLRLQRGHPGAGAVTAANKQSPVLAASSIVDSLEATTTTGRTTGLGDSCTVPPDSVLAQFKLELPQLSSSAFVRVAVFEWTA
ncbi:hypothetical protein E2562_022079 [Oryza meyeriana var. granulata]|uniref:Uncharacterized protein n=1 Tax=Oryza meyeriana var. granulata TaxID=110450 RepID=A0A6G1ENQ5_9ORYZ|nr:hypothetical protein E2562_022079 [Oryza meyeriana var. granulata]